MAIRRSPRIEKAFAMRPLALKLIKAHGGLHTLQCGTTIVIAEHRGFIVQYHHPIEISFKPPLELNAVPTRSTRYGNLPYDLRVRAKHHYDPGMTITVMSLLWDEEGNSHLVKFLSGEWEARLAKVAADISLSQKRVTSPGKLLKFRDSPRAEAIA